MWDIGKNNKVRYFDPTLSYEITGYRPIDGTHGLDFDPDWFTKPRDVFLKTGHYTQYHIGTKGYRDFWRDIYRHCRHGMTVNGYTITGDNFYFLNFYRMKNSAGIEKAGSGRGDIFPKFEVAQYIYFHYIELCRYVKKDSIGLKARGVGFSEIGASIVSNSYQCIKNSRNVVAAFSEQLLGPTRDKCWVQLNFCNESTDGGMVKLRQKYDSNDRKKASAMELQEGRNVETGFMSEILMTVADIPRKIRGDRADLLLYEESGSWPNFKKAWNTGDKLVGVGGNKHGIKIGWGTGGDSGPALSGLAEAYENPEAYNVLPYRHNYTQTGEYVLSGFFIPAYAIVNVPGYMDHRGWCDPKKAKQRIDEERNSKIKNPELYMFACAESCYTAEEALSMEGTNKFNKVFITNQIARIKLYKEGPKIQNGDLQFVFKSADHSLSNASDVKWIPDENGPIHIIEHPLWTDDNANKIKGQEKEKVFDIMNNLYVAGIDSIDMGSDQTSSSTSDPSKFCITIKRRTFGMREPTYVAYYMDRPNDERIAYRKAMALLMYYNCLCNIEATKISMLNYAKVNGFGNYFMYRPNATYPAGNGRHSRTIGTPATPAIIDHQNDLIAQYVEDDCGQIWFPEMLDQLSRYSLENKRKFDIIAAMAMTELADEELCGVVPKETDENASNKWHDIGYYTDMEGVKHFGVLPDSNVNQQSNKSIQTEYDTNRVRTSNPRFID